MKIRTLSTLLAALTLTPLAFTQAQTTVTTSTEPVQVVTPATTTSTTVQTTNSEGTIQEFTPGSSRIVLKTTSGSPVTYSYSKKTTFVDSAGNVVDYTTIKSGEPTTVYYTTEAGQPVVSKVVVNRTVAAPVTKTTTSETTTSTTSKH